MSEITATDIRRAAMDLLARREHGFSELCSKLTRRFSKADGLFRSSGSATNGEDSVEIDLGVLLIQELQKLQAEGLQSDERLADVFIQARANRGQGPVKIKAELRGKGISDQIIANAFECCDVDWRDLARSVSDKRFGTDTFAPKDIKTRAKQVRFLQQRGFSFDHISYRRFR
jgi:regulatory protein